MERELKLYQAVSALHSHTLLSKQSYVDGTFAQGTKVYASTHSIVYSGSNLEYSGKPKASNIYVESILPVVLIVRVNYTTTEIIAKP